MCITSYPHPPNHFFLSLDAEKAFHRVAWDYMAEVLKTLGYQDHVLHFILVLYSSPTARLKVNSDLLDALSVSNGICQGCPPIFVLTLEPILRRLRANPDITGVEVKDR